MAVQYPPLRVFLYQGNKGTTLVEELSARVEGLRFTTGAHGGFRDCTFSLKLSQADAFEWYQKPGRFFWRIVVREGEAGGRIVWEGRIEDVRWEPGKATVHVTAYGYWRACFDRLYTDATTFATGTFTGSAIIGTILTTACPDVGTGRSNIVDPGVNLVPWKTSVRGGSYPGDLIVQVAKLSDGTNGAYYFFVYDDREPYLALRGTGTVDWTVDLRDTEGLSLERSAADFWTRVTASYENGSSGTGTLGTATSDADAESTYLRREYLLVISTQQTNATAANNAAGWKLSQSKEIQQHAAFSVGGPVFAGTNAVQEQPSWRVRAGDVVRVRDLVPNSQDLGSATLDSLRTFYVIETEYDADRRTLRVLPDRPSLDLPSLLERGGIGAQE